MWKVTEADFATYAQIFKSFEKVALANYSPDLGLFEKGDGEKHLLALTPAAGRFCADLPGLWSDVEKPLSEGWALLIGDGGALAKKGLDLAR